MTTRVIGLGTLAVELVATGPRSHQVLEALHRVPTSSRSPGATLTLTEVADGIRCEESSPFDTPDPVLRRRAGSAGEWLLGRLSHHLVDRCDSGLMVHGAAVARGTRVLVLAGATGAGKTSLVTWLLAQTELAYLTDELVLIGPGRDLETLPRPLNLKKAGWDLLRPLARNPGLTLTWRGGCLAGPERWGNVAPDHSGQLTAVLFPRWDPAATEASLQPLTAAQVAQQLLGATVNARNLADQGVAHAVACAREAPGWSLRYGDFDQLDPAALEGLLR